jgi:hypothetical protein
VRLNPELQLTARRKDRSLIAATGGHIYATPSGFRLIVLSSDLGSAAWQARRWGFMKKDLGFAELRVHGADRGIFVLNEPQAMLRPTSAHAPNPGSALCAGPERHLERQSS